MVVETDDKEERTGETEETPSDNSALIGWLGAIHAEIRALSGRIERLEGRVGHLEQRVTRIETERERKNRLIMWLGIGIGALIGAGGVVVGVIGLLN